MKVFTILGIVFAALSLIFVGAAIGTGRWYVIDTTSSEVELGLKNQCVLNRATNVEECKEIDLDPTHLQHCNRTTDDMKKRFLVTQILVAVSVGTGALAFICAIVSLFVPITKIVSAIFGVLALLSICAALGLYAHTLEKWFFCNQDFCDYFAQFYVGQECDSSLGYSCIFIAVSVPLFIMQVVFVILGGGKEKPNAPQRDGGHGPKFDKSKAGHHSPALSPRHTPRERENEPVEGEHTYAGEDAVDDWTPDEDTGYLWSEKLQQYFDEESGHYYDPEQDQWYDPDEDRWYAA